MKHQLLWVSALMFLSQPSVTLADSNAKELFTKLCSSCHVTSGKPTIAPPIFGVINHVKSAHPTKEAFVNRIVSWVGNPQQDRALMRGAIRKFGLMPKLLYKEDDVRVIAEYLYDGKEELPEWYKEHYKKEHGKKPKL